MDKVKLETKSISRQSSTEPAQHPTNIISGSVDNGCHIVFQTIAHSYVADYLTAIKKKFGNGSVVSAGRLCNQFTHIYMQSDVLMQKVLKEGITVQGQLLQAAQVKEAGVRIILTGVLPFLPNQVIEDALSAFCRPQSQIIPIYMREDPSVLTFNRIVYASLILGTDLPNNVVARFQGVKYIIQLNWNGNQNVQNANKENSANFPVRVNLAEKRVGQRFYHQERNFSDENYRMEINSGTKTSIGTENDESMMLDTVDRGGASGSDEIDGMSVQDTISQASVQTGGVKLKKRKSFKKGLKSLFKRRSEEKVELE